MKKIVCLFTILFVLLGFLYWKRPPEIAVYDKQKVMSLFVKELSRFELDDSTIQHKTMIFKKALQDALIDNAEKHHQIIFTKKTLVAGGRDVTKDVLRSLVEHMRGAK